MFVTGKTGNNQNVFTRELVDQTMWDPHADAKSLQSSPTLCDLIDGNPPGSVIPGILQARTLDWVAISFSNAWKWKVKVKSLSRVRLPGTHGLQPTRLLRPWDFPGKSTRVGCHRLLLIMDYNAYFLKRNMKYLYIRLQSDLQDIVKIAARWRKYVSYTVIHLRRGDTLMYACICLC